MKHLFLLLALLTPFLVKAQSTSNMAIGDSLYSQALHIMPNDTLKALKILEKGTRKGHSPCCNLLGDYHKKHENYKKAAKWYALADDPEGRYELGCLYLNGQIGKQGNEDLMKALTLIRSAEQSNYRDAIYLTAMLFFNGDILEQNYDSAAFMLLRLEPLNDGPALFTLARFSEEGYGVGKDSVAAFNYYKRAAEAGICGGFDQMGHYYLAGEGGVDKDSAEAFLHFSLSAGCGNGNPDGLYNVATCYLQGIGTRIDTAKGLYHLREALQAGSADAAALFGDFYHQGIGDFPIDIDSAIHYYHLASLQDNPRGDLMMGAYLYDLGDYNNAIPYLQSAIDNGSKEAAIIYAQALLTGNGVEQNAEMATAWLNELLPYDKDGTAHLLLGVANLYGLGTERNLNMAKQLIYLSAQQGDDKAMMLMGQLYNGTEGIERDTLEAVSWYEKAVAAGNTDAMLQLGGSYMTGITAPHNPQRAAELFAKAAESGNTEGMCLLGICYEEGIGTSTDLRKAYSLYRQAAEAGSPFGMRLLAYCYGQGIYVEQDMAKAAEWYELAAESGDAQSALILGQLYAKGEGVKKSKREARRWLKKADQLGLPDARQTLEKL